MFSKYGKRMINEARDELIILLQEKEKQVTESKEEMENLDYQIFKQLTIIIHFLIDFIDRVSPKDNKDEELFNAFRYVNNALKHKGNLIRLVDTNGYTSFPIEFPLKPSRFVCEWTQAEEIEDKQREKQKNAYNNRIYSKGVIITINEIVKVISKY